MPSTLMESVIAMLPQVAGPLASKLGESTTAVNRGVESSAAAMIATLANRAKDAGFMSTILNLLSSAEQPQSMAAAAAAAASSSAGAGGLGSKFLSTLFGSDRSALIGMIARGAGLQRSSAEGILGAAAPLVMGVLGDRVRQGGLGVSALASLAGSEASQLSSYLPTGFGSLLSGAGAAAASAIPSAHRAAPAVSQAASPSWRLPLLLLGLLLLGGLIWLLTRTSAPETKVAETASTAASAVKETAKDAASSVADAAKSAVTALGEFFKKKLPNGVELNIPANGIENHLIGFIDDKSKVVDKTTWFNFDRLLFDTGKATLQPTSQEQVSNIAAILKAYPTVKVKIGGYTDNTGDKNANLALSDARAKTVVAELVKLGVPAARMAAEGYGDAHPVASNDTEEGRQQNRRIAIRVTEK